MCVKEHANIYLSSVDLASNCRLEYENRNIRKEKKELAAYEALMKSKKNNRTE